MTADESTISLRSRVFGASVWVLAGFGASQVIRLGSSLIMTRLLMPEMFGVMAIANIFLVGLALFSDLGLRQNIIQSKRGDDPLFLNTVWTIQILRGAVLWALTIGVGLMLNSLSDRWRVCPSNLTVCRRYVGN